MTSHNPFTCYIIGTESLLIQCAEILQHKGHKILGIISDEPQIISWAQERSISIIAPGEGLASRLAGEPFDYLFSITNLRIIPDDVLALPRRGAINFHDGPLPKYAGLYATTWALLNGEKEHGITWHLMHSEVDKGEILKQKLFPVAPGETAFTLNVKCYEAGMETFAELVDELANGRVQPRPQDLSQQSYYGKYRRPEAAGVIFWKQPAERIAALVRALDFGSYANPLVLPKLVMGQAVYAVREVAVTPLRSGKEPGMITAVSSDAITVATLTNDVQILRLTTLSGQPVSLEDIITRFISQPGYCLPELEPAIAENLTALNNAICRQEGYWVRQLAHLNPVELPYANRVFQTNSTHETTIQSVPAVVARRPDAADWVAVAVAAWLARLSGQELFDIGFSHRTLQRKVAGFESFFADLVPFRVAIEPKRPIGDTLQSLREALHTFTQKRKTFAWDVLGRYPELTNLREQKDHFLLPVSIVQADNHFGYRPTHKTELTFVVAEDGSAIEWVYDTAVYTPEAIKTMQTQLDTFLRAAMAENGRSLAETPILSAAEQQKILTDWNNTSTPYPADKCVHELIADQAARTPDETAVIFENTHLTYHQLDQRANQLAHHLQKLGITPDTPVGVYMDRSAEMMIALLGILKAGGAYLPLDPAYPAARIAFMIEDTNTPLLITQSHLVHKLPPHQATVIRIDSDWATIATQPDTPPQPLATPDHLAYIIYTSGSTGKPKGVMVRHRNVVNFFAGMDERIPHNPPGVWLAVTSLSFDISVLELFWTLARGFKVVIYADKTKEQANIQALTSPFATRAIDFSLFYFASDESEEGVADKYRLLLEGAKYGDKHGYAAVWTPERHFHAFGGLYPNPSVASAAIAAVTERIHIRAGSCVLPLHSPIRVAEEWALVDNISRGRVGISFAAGWQPNDFVLRPENYADRKAIMFRDIEVVKRLWRGESVTLPGPRGDVSVRTLPRPVQAELPIWITAAGNPETFRMAGEGGFHILTHLLGQSVEELAEKVAIYRQAWAEAGHLGHGQVTLMLHTFIGEDDEQVREIVREPMKAYLRSSVALIKQAAWYFPTFKQRAEVTGKSPIELLDSDDLTDEDMEALLDFAFERYFETSGLFGTPETAVHMVNKLKEVGVDEIACLIDFGVPSETVLQHLPYLTRLKEMAKPVTEMTDFSIPALIHRHQVTHFQCTPSMASMLLLDDDTRTALAQVQVMMVGGEALPPHLAEQLKRIVPGKVMNMYGPTETTIWSTTYEVTGTETAVPIGTPIANTQIYILDKHRQPVPIGIPGELYIGGDGVVRGYLNRPELTAERFLPDPFSHQPDAKMYRTGDLARWLPDGCIEFLGRADFQVKIRGYRIELGEIETLLNQHPAIREAVVIAREDTPGDKRLVAYYIPHAGQQPTTDELRQHLRQTLPDFMIPSHFVPMSAFPLTPNKKTDRKALPAPDQVLQQKTADFIPPASDLERTIAEIWQELLGVPQVGLNDNFFDLGGHSLLTVQAHRRLRQVIDKELTITDMFRFPTIRALVDYINEAGENGQINGTQKGTDRAAARRQALMRRRRSR